MDHYDFYGDGWLAETLRLIQEDKRDHYLTLKMLIPLARAPMDKESGRAAASYERNVTKALNSLVPSAAKIERRSLISPQVRKKLKSGSIVVIPDGSDGTTPLFKNAPTLES